MRAFATTWKPTVDLVGQRFGKLVVERKAPTLKAARWWVRCDCGESFIDTGCAIRRREKEAKLNACCKCRRVRCE